MHASDSIYWSSTTNFSPITIWILTRSHLKEESSGLPLILKKEQLYSLEILLATQNTGHSYVTFTKLQHQQLQLLSCLQVLLEDPELYNQYQLLQSTQRQPYRSNDRVNLELIFHSESSDSEDQEVFWRMDFNQTDKSHGSALGTLKKMTPPRMSFRGPKSQGKRSTPLEEASSPQL